MLEELLRRLKKRELTEQEENEVLNQIQDATKIIEENSKQRVLEKSVLEEINKDPAKVERLNEIDIELAKLNKKVSSCEFMYHLLAIIAVLSIIVGTCGLFVLGATIFSSLIFAILLPILSDAAFMGGCYPIVKLISNKYYKHWDKINELNREKQAILNSVNIKDEKTMKVETTNTFNSKEKQYEVEKISEDVNIDTI